MTDIDPNAPYDPEVQGNFDFEDMVFVLDTGERLPITNMIDSEKNDVTDVVDAYSVVAGPLASGGYLILTITDEDLREAGLIE